MKSDADGEEKKEEPGTGSPRVTVESRPPKPGTMVPDHANAPNPNLMTNKPSLTLQPSMMTRLGRGFLPLLSLSAQLVLFACFLALAAVYCLRSFHDDYFLPMVNRARRTDEDLLTEFTYYERDCNMVDVTTAGVEDAEDLFIRPDSKNFGVDQMMTHGSVLFPGLLSRDTVRNLRQFIVDKNAAIKGTPAEFPVSQGYRRISYGIDATEDPSVVRALKEIHDNVELQRLLEGLLGENPALTEITAITASYGCKHQVWHPDVKADGNGVMFGRTYSHSYSLFMPLQNTTGAMGATDLCPGTHYCASPDLVALCEHRKIGMHQVSGQGFWPEGSAALFNQQVWHRGAAHTDRNAQERIVFIVSFLARPNDTRQLSRGTYFHMKWNMWGHTWKDLEDSARYMSWPWNIFTSLHIWRPESHGWGYDLLTAAAMRIGNNQLGCEPEDLEKFLQVLDDAGFPGWLDGTIDTDDDEAWQIYLRETLANYWNFLLKVNLQAVGGYFALVLIISVVQASRGRPAIRILSASAKGLLISHFIVIALATHLLFFIRSRSWAEDIVSGRMLMRPFPPVPSTLFVDPSVSTGPTTFPNRRDVLFGGRLDARTIGAYNRWLEFHPGNQDFLKSMASSSLYRSYVRDLPPAFPKAVVDAAMEPILSKGGRFLQEDYRTGDWLYMRTNERDAKVKQALYIGVEGPLYELRKELDFVIADARFGFSRETIMAKKSLLFLYDLSFKLFGRFAGNVNTSSSEKDKTITRVLSSSLFNLKPVQYVGQSRSTPRDWISRWTSKPLSKCKFTEGEELIYNYTNRQTGQTQRVRATLIKIHGDAELLDIAFYNDDIGTLGVMKTVSVGTVEKAPTLDAGSLVWANYEDQGEWLPGKIVLIGANALADVEFDDGGFEEMVERHRYEPRF